MVRKIVTCGLPLGVDAAVWRDGGVLGSPMLWGSTRSRQSRERRRDDDRSICRTSIFHGMARNSRPPVGSSRCRAPRGSARRPVSCAQQGMADRPTARGVSSTCREIAQATAQVTALMSFGFAPIGPARHIAPARARPRYAPGMGRPQKPQRGSYCSEAPPRARVTAGKCTFRGSRLPGFIGNHQKLGEITGLFPHSRPSRSQSLATVTVPGNADLLHLCCFICQREMWIPAGRGPYPDESGPTCTPARPT
jgi:hypothetical protein